ncbi:Sulfatase [Hexamita inflata]|uniref:Sulfatase n=1 Tax=Hexamita inflata TaxID=28002 RepID=A0AA86NWS2_9EUKA|nr:Sulfatase [Hexamita inflata]
MLTASNSEYTNVVSQTTKRQKQVKVSAQKAVQTRIQVISFISLIFPAIVRYTFTTMQKTNIAYSVWNIVPHLIILAAEGITMWTLQQALLRVLPKTFWSRAAVGSFLMVQSFLHLFIAMFDLLLNYGLLMRFATNVSLAYYLVKPPELFDTTLPVEGQKFPGDLGAVFAKHCLEAQKKEAIIMGSWFATVLLIIFVRFVVVFYNKFCLRQLPKPHPKKHLPKPVLSIVSATTMTLFVLYLYKFNADRFDDMVPAHWYFYRSSIKQQIPAGFYKTSVEKLRTKYVLPEGEEWLDQRQVPVYPLVHGPKAFADAYNKKIATKIEKPEAEKLPNVVVLLWESFTPAPKYVTDEVLLNEKPIMNGQPYRREYLPKLAELAESGHAFMGVRSNGIPTINGWHGLITGEISSFKGVNMINSAYNSVDDFPTRLRQQGYHSLMVWPSSFSADKKQNYVFRGRKQMLGPEFLEQFPLWFDDIHQFYPSKEEADMMGIEDYPDYQNYWTNDRVSSQMFNHFFNEQVKNSGKPVLGFYGNVDTHEDFNGFDDDKQYEDFTFGVGRSNRYEVYGRHDAYSTVLKYSDAAFGRIFDNIKKNAPETIVVVVGDHASRQVPLYLDADKKINEESEIYYDLNCNGRSVGADQQFTTSAVISYFGSNEKLKQKFASIQNKTTFEPADHQDLVHTVMGLVSELSGTKLPSSRLGVDLISNADKLVNNEPTTKVPKISTSHINMEYSDERGLFRMSLHGTADGYQVTKSLPSCIQNKNSINTHIPAQVHKDAKNMLKLLTYLSQNNRYYSYQFRDEKCVLEGNCEFPEPNETFDAGVIRRMFKLIMRLTIKLVVLLYVITTVLEIVSGIFAICKTFLFKMNTKPLQLSSVFNTLVIKSTTNEIVF